MDRTWECRSHLAGVDWTILKDDLGRDNFDNGRTADELRLSFERSHATVTVWCDRRVVGTARVLSDGVCNAYIVDVWTQSSYRRQGIGTAMVRALLETVPGQHVALLTDKRSDLYSSLGFVGDDGGMSLVAGSWLNRAARASSTARSSGHPRPSLHARP